MITKQQYTEILNRMEIFLLAKQKDKLSVDYNNGFIAAVDIIKNLVENK